MLAVKMWKRLVEEKGAGGSNREKRVERKKRTHSTNGKRSGNHLLNIEWNVLITLGKGIERGDGRIE